MKSPSYVNDLASVYTQMYNHPGHERPLNEKYAPSTLTNREVEDDEDDPDWKKLIRKHAKKQKRHMAPTVADASKDDIPDAYEGEEEVVQESPIVGMLGRMAIPYATSAIQKFVTKHGQREKERRAGDEEHPYEGEENSKANLAIKLVLELIGDAEHDEAAANALYMIRDLVK